jgi:hypothetical protein
VLNYCWICQVFNSAQVATILRFFAKLCLPLKASKIMCAKADLLLIPKMLMLLKPEFQNTDGKPSTCKLLQNVNAAIVG